MHAVGSGRHFATLPDGQPGTVTMPFSWKERRAFRDIEEHLAAEDPALAGLLAAGDGPARWLVRRVRRCVVTAAVTLVVLGMILDIGGLMVGGFLMLSTLPVLLAIVWH